MTPRRLVACGTLLCVLLSLPACRPPDDERSSNVLLIVVDTLRPDHLGSYGYPRPTSPHLDELARRGARFTNARASSSWTLPSVASMMTGLYPAVHGAETLGAVLSDRVPTMSQAFRKAGYATAVFSANPAFVTPAQGLAQGFERFEVLHGPPTDKDAIDAVTSDASLLHWSVGATADDVTSAALEWVASHSGERPFFLYLHYFDPHAAYSPSAEMSRRFGVTEGEPLLGSAQWLVLRAPSAPTPPVLATLISLYDAEIATTDAAIGRLLDRLRPEVVESTLIVVTADHGEEFAEHGGLQHGRTLFDELLRVPLLIAGRGVQAAMRVDAPVSLVGLWPTIAALVDAGEPPPAIAEASFAPLLRSEPAGPVTVFADLDARFLGDAQRHRRAVVEGSWKLLMDPQRGTALFDLASDPGEHRDRVQDARERRSAMRMQIVDRDAVALASRAAAPPGVIVLDPIRRAQLQALGYLE